jgi:sugar phosphate isomerase/epimerase
MRLSDDRHLSYCTNVHPGESLDEVRATLAGPVAAVKARFCPDAPFGVGLRLSARAAEELDGPRALAELRALLDEHGLYVFTLNGFPFGAFHGERIKERVYLPDWLDERRLTYTEQLARICAALTPDELGTVSTVPGAFAQRLRGEADVVAIAGRLRWLARALERLRLQTGKTILIALEPEPGCMLETTDDAIAFFSEHLLGGSDEVRVRRHIGLCIDACHLAVAFERPSEAIRRVRAAGIAIGKIQLSTALHVASTGRGVRRALDAFADEVYLHQVSERRGDVIQRYLDLDRAGEPAPGAEWRVHFHVPIFMRELGPFENTQPELVELMSFVQESGCRHLEVETYTWGLLPAGYRKEPLADAITRELRWARARL